MAVNQLIARGIAPIGQDLPQIGNMLFQRDQARQQNALAQMGAQADMTRANAFAEQVRGSQASAEEARVREAMQQDFDNVVANPQLMPQFLGLLRSTVAPDLPDNVTLPEIALRFRLKAPAPVAPFEVQDVDGFRVLTQGGRALPGGVQAPQREPPAGPAPDNRTALERNYAFIQSLPPEQRREAMNLLRANATPEIAQDTAFATQTGKSDEDFLSNFGKVQRSYETTLNGFDRTMRQIDKAASQANAWTTGIMSGADFVRGSPQYNLKATLTPILASIGFDKLQNMRDNSPTGGALGQVSERELAFLQGTIASLDTAQSPEQFREALGEVKRAYQQYQAATRRALAQDGARAAALRKRYNRGGAAPSDQASESPAAAPAGRVVDFGSLPP